MGNHSLVLIRGLPGVGRANLAEQMRDEFLDNEQSVCLINVDDYFEQTAPDPHDFVYDPAKLPEAHLWCQEVAEGGLREGYCTIIYNTASQRWEMEPYLKLALRYGAAIQVVDLFDGGLNDEELSEQAMSIVSPKAIAKMRAGWEHDWQQGDPRPPGKRD